MSGLGLNTGLFFWEFLTFMTYSLFQELFPIVVPGKGFLIFQNVSNCFFFANFKSIGQTDVNSLHFIL